MKKLITAEIVRQEHGAGRKRIEVALPQTIVTAEARSLAEQLGVELAETVQGFVAKGSSPAGPSGVDKNVGKNAAGASPGNDIAAIRAAILAKLPPGCVSDAVVDQLIEKALEEKRLSGGDASSGAEGPSFQSRRIARGIKHVAANSVNFGRFEGAGAANQVGLTDVVGAEDGSPMAVGYMAWSNCFFPWTLNYDEVDVVLEGELHIRSEGQTVVGRPGDVIFIPKGAVIEFGTPSSTRFLYVTYPANWQEG